MTAGIKVTQIKELTDPDKRRVRRLFEEAAGGPRPLTEAQLVRHIIPIICAVAGMKNLYENQTRPGYEVAAYYTECWQKIDQAWTLAQLIDALDYLRLSIETE